MTVIGGPDIVEDGLVLYLDAANPDSYPGSGTAWKDLSGNGNDGVMENGPTFDDGNNGSIVFDGINDRVQTPFFTFNTNFSVAFVMYIRELYNYGDPVGATNSINADRGMTFVTYANGSMSFNLGNAVNLWSNGVLLPGGTFSSGKFYYICGVANGTDLKVYVNGALAGQNASGNNNGSFVNYKIILGMRRPSSSYPFRGSVAALKVYNRTLSAEEVLQNYNATKSRYGL